MSEWPIATLWIQFLRINFYIFSGLVLASGALALISSGKTADVAAKCCLVFAILLTLGCFVRVLYKLNKTLLKR